MMISVEVIIFSIILESLNSTVDERSTRYNIDKPDWSLYE